MMISVILVMMLFSALLSILMMLCCTLNITRSVIDFYSWSRLLSFNLTFETLEWCMKWFITFNTGKSQLVLFDRLNLSGAIDVKTDYPVLDEKYFLRCLDFINWIRP